MKRIFLTSLLLSIVYLSFSQDIKGTYYVNGDKTKMITIDRIEDNIYKIMSDEGWYATGIYYRKDDKKTLMTVWYYANGNFDNDRGIHSAVLQENGNDFEVHIKGWKSLWNKPFDKKSKLTWIKAI